MHVAIIERKLFGGTCVNTGCIPTKTMAASAYAAHVARHAADFGVAIEGTIEGRVSVDMPRVKARKDAVSGKSSGRAGLTEAEVRKTGRRALVGKRPMTKVARALEKANTGLHEDRRGCANA